MHDFAHHRTNQTQNAPLMRQCRGRSAFTIIELIVVIGIITVLLGLAFPAIGMMRLVAFNTEDLSQIRQLGLGHIAYQNVYSERFVDVGLPHGGYGDEARSFVQTLEPFLGSPILKSPLDRSPFWETGMQNGEGSEPVRRRTSYGMNNYLSRNYSPEVALYGPGAAADRLTKVQQPDKVVSFLHMAPTGSFAVSDHPHVENWSFGQEPWRLANDQVAIWAAEGKPSVSEFAESNYGFVDGSTSSRSFDEVYKDSQYNLFDPKAQLP